MNELKMEPPSNPLWDIQSELNTLEQELYEKKKSFKALQLAIAALEHKITSVKDKKQVMFCNI